MIITTCHPATILLKHYVCLSTFLNMPPCHLLKDHNAIIIVLLVFVMFAFSKPTKPATMPPHNINKTLSSYYIILLLVFVMFIFNNHKTCHHATILLKHYVCLSIILSMPPCHLFIDCLKIIMLSL